MQKVGYILSFLPLHKLLKQVNALLRADATDDYEHVVSKDSFETVFLKDVLRLALLAEGIEHEIDQFVVDVGTEIALAHATLDEAHKVAVRPLMITLQDLHHTRVFGQVDEE